jgi:acyl-CoA thioester hydrolase
VAPGRVSVFGTALFGTGGLQKTKIIGLPMKPEALNEFPLVVSLPLQWGDQDAYGHVNNTVYLRWCETARIEYLRKIGLWIDLAPGGVGPILASITCDYRRPLTYPDTIRVGARITKIGNTSFRMEHRIWSDRQKAVAAEAHSTIVVLDYSDKKPVRVPDPARQAISKFEGRAL